MRAFLLIIMVLLSLGLNAQNVRIGILRNTNCSRVLFSYFEGSYLIYGDGSPFGAILPTESVSVQVIPGGKVKLNKGVVLIGEFNKVELKATGSNHALRIKSLSPSLKERKHDDDFSIVASGNKLTIINHVSMTDYLAGVVESEGGGGRAEEYYKVQAIMSRTYAVKYSTRHRKEGFDLCDQVHCQAYHNRLTYTPEIYKAVEETTNLVMEDENKKLVDGFFHANCGGQTSEPQFVWNEAIPYLKSFRDTFCIHTRQATWEKRIPKKDWRAYLVAQFAYPENDSLYKEKLYWFAQPERLAFFHGPELGIPLRDIRTKFNLRSTFFSCFPEGDEVVLKGRGFGHGVGLCQEGAMRMAKAGFAAEQILKFYFPGVVIRERNDNSYYEQPEKSPFDF
ncbi:SpoIID/LytB domain-containing protein [Wandonia haliotis]